MQDDDSSDKRNYLSAKDVAQWAEQEIEEAAKAFQLRTQEVSQLAKAYSAGEITPQEADAMHSRYFHRWGESLPGVTLGPNVTDEQVIASMDKEAERIRGPFGNSFAGPGSHTDRLAPKGGQRKRVRE